MSSSANNNNTPSILTDPARLFLPIAGFECGECRDCDEDSDLPVTFYCNLPTTTIISNDVIVDDESASSKRFLFGCRKPSFGVLTDKEETVESFDASAMDPNFFDAGYTLAGSTGFCVWAGARFMVEALALAGNHNNNGLSNNNPSDLELPNIKGCRILELGAGVGVLGTALAWAGAEVLVTDLRSLVDYAVIHNLLRNSEESCEKSPPAWLIDHDAETLHSRSTHSIGQGWASATALDWSLPLEDQISIDILENTDIIVASDCVWLASLLDMLLDTVDALFQRGAGSFLLAFQRRGRNIGSATFTTETRLMEVVENRGWSLKPLAWRPVTLVDKTENAVCLVEIRPHQ